MTTNDETTTITEITLTAGFVFPEGAVLSCKEAEEAEPENWPKSGGIPVLFPLVFMGAWPEAKTPELCEKAKVLRSETQKDIGLHIYPHEKSVKMLSSKQYSTRCRTLKSVTVVQKQHDAMSATYGVKYVIEEHYGTYVDEA